MSDPRTNSGFGGRDSRGGSDFQSRDRKFGGSSRPSGAGGFGSNRGGFADNRGGFGDRNAAGPRVMGADSYQKSIGGGFAQRDERPAAPAREGFSYERKGGFNDRFAGDRNAGAAPRGDFAPRKPAFSKPAGGGKVFVPRDAQKRFSKNDR